MIPIDVQWHQDPETLDGIAQPVPSRLMLPLPSLEPIELPECTVRPAGTKGVVGRIIDRVRSAFQDSSDTPEADAAAEPPVLAPAAFTDWLVQRLPRHGAVEAVDPQSPAFGRVVAAAHAGLAMPPLDTGTNLPEDVTDATLLASVEHIVRACALPDAVAFSILRSHPPLASVSNEVLRARIQSAAVEGLCHACTVANPIVEEMAQAEAAAAQERDAREEARRIATTPERIDLGENDLCEFVSDDVNPWGRQCVFRTHGLPVGEATILITVPRVEGGFITAHLRSTGTVMLTPEQQGQIGTLPDVVAMSLAKMRQSENRGRGSYSASDFPKTTVSGENTAALKEFRKHARRLIPMLVGARGVAGYAHQALLTLVVGYAPRVSLARRPSSRSTACR